MHAHCTHPAMSIVANAQRYRTPCMLRCLQLCLELGRQAYLHRIGLLGCEAEAVHAVMSRAVLHSSIEGQ